MTLRDEIAAYERMQAELETEHNGSWVMIRDGKLQGVFDDFETTAEDAVKRFGRGPYLIRQVGAGPITLPSSVMRFEPGHVDRHADR